MSEGTNSTYTVAFSEDGKGKPTELLGSCSCLQFRFALFPFLSKFRRPQLQIRKRTTELYSQNPETELLVSSSMMIDELKGGTMSEGINSTYTDGFSEDGNGKPTCDFEEYDSDSVVKKSKNTILGAQNVEIYEEEDKEDRLSELPECLIHHIMSFMETKPVVQTCVLSKQWSVFIVVGEDLVERRGERRLYMLWLKCLKDLIMQKMLL
ncbi:F-box family protein [Quillaja saponaria]|uniref:F-box family protein n=1 Tax=Quillaja saponaria TaxID=32244 RepID=A0AAD7PEA0_QUISA|nr:F-box family protein [Quillaja saponaria]